MWLPCPTTSLNRLAGKIVGLPQSLPATAISARFCARSPLFQLRPTDKSGCAVDCPIGSPVSLVSDPDPRNFHRTDE